MNTEQVIKISEIYHLNPIENVQIIRNEDHLLVKLTDTHKQNFYLKGEKAERTHWEKCCEYATYLKINGLPVSSYLKNNQNQYTTEYKGLVLTMEQAVCGESVEVINDNKIFEIGKLLGQQHQLSLQYKSTFQQATSWSMFGGNTTDRMGDYDENELSFIDFIQHFSNQPLCNEIKKYYLEKRTLLKEFWHALPQGAVQGDFCYYNLLFSNDFITGIYDFNLAGDEVYLNECIAVGVYHAWHVEYEGSLAPLDRFQQFISAYTSQRPFKAIELNVLNDLFAIIRAFRFDRIEDGIALTNPLDINQFMEETLSILTDARGEFLSSN
ncbi:hypothetical protein [Bacillus sp. FJAT-52991]|uniref:Aminoglycoside phosphotransferase domain-containing protein n=1 Tax=Bacillus kandeliae TaxID=3129297 RepID=A0ABZ2NAQ7_9BACI